MRVVVTAETRFARSSDGAVWTPDGPAYGFWTRYLSAFDNVRIIARVRDTAAPVDGAHRVDGPGVEVWPIPYYLGPRQYLLRRPAIGKAVHAATTDTDAVILRVPSPVGSLLATARQRQGLPYALEVVSDPYDVLAPGVVDHPARPVLRRWLTARLRRECRRAAAVSYVTERTLQARYPASPSALTVACSSANLPPEAYVPGPRTAGTVRRTGTLVSVGSLDQLYKGIDTLIAALARLRAGNPELRLIHVGDGRYRLRLEQLAARLGVTDRVLFTGVLPAGAAVRQHLDAADLFVLPSRTEGLPRALIEAMARALPAIASTAGGIPELLPAEDLVPPDDPGELAAAIDRIIGDPVRMAAASDRNLGRAHDFSTRTLTPRREAFYRAVADMTGQHVLVGGGTW